MGCSCHRRRSSGMSGYQVLTIDGLGGIGAAALAPFSMAMMKAAQDGFQAGYEGRGRTPPTLAGADKAQLDKLAREYNGAFQRGDETRRKLPPQPRVAGAIPQGEMSVPDGVPPAGDAPKGKALGGPTTTYCAQDSGQGGWRDVGGRWHYAHHEGLILSSLAAKYLGDGSAWKLIWNGSKERGLLPSNATPDRIPVRDSSGQRITFWMPDEGIAKARALGCIPEAGVAGALAAIPTWAKVVGVVGLVGGGLYLATREG